MPPKIRTSPLRKRIAQNNERIQKNLRLKQNLWERSTFDAFLDQDPGSNNSFKQYLGSYLQTHPITPKSPNKHVNPIPKNDSENKHSHAFSSESADTNDDCSCISSSKTKKIQLRSLTSGRNGLFAKTMIQKPIMKHMLRFKFTQQQNSSPGNELLRSRVITMPVRKPFFDIN